MKSTFALPVVLAGVISAQCAYAAVERESAFNLCIAQPMLQTDSIAHVYDDMMSRPHPPGLDTMTKEQAINALQWREGNVCAEKLMVHPDVFGALGLHGIISGRNPTLGSDWWNAWYAFNQYCEMELSAACIDREVAAAKAVSASAGTPAGRTCSLVLSSDDPVEVAECIRLVGPPRDGDEALVLPCSADEHSIRDGAQAGKAIHACFRSPSIDLAHGRDLGYQCSDPQALRSAMEGRKSPNCTAYPPHWIALDARVFMRRGAHICPLPPRRLIPDAPGVHPVLIPNGNCFRLDEDYWWVDITHIEGQGDPDTSRYTVKFAGDKKEFVAVVSRDALIEDSSDDPHTPEDGH